MDARKRTPSTRMRQRVAAVSALAVSFGAVVVVGAGAVGGESGGAVEAAVRPVGAADVRLAGRLDALRPGASPRPAQEAAREALAAGRQGLAVLGTPKDRRSRQAAAALRSHQRLVDAIGSTLANPRSVLRDRLAAMAAETARAFDAIGVAAAGHAGELPAQHLADFSRRRAAG